MLLENKVAVITGAAQGIGAAFALGYAKEGAQLVVADIVDGSIRSMISLERGVKLSL